MNTAPVRNHSTTRADTPDPAVVARIVNARISVALGRSGHPDHMSRLAAMRRRGEVHDARWFDLEMELIL